MDIFLDILSCIQNNPLPVFFMIIILCTFLLAAIFLLVNRCKLNTLFFDFIDSASKIAQIIALIIGISYGYSAISTYDVKKMEEEKKKLQGDIHVMQALIEINSEILESKNIGINELTKKINNLNLITRERENELKHINKEKYILRHELNLQEAELDKQYKILFRQYFLYETYNTLCNIWIRHINGLRTEQNMQEKLNKYMPSPYNIIIESLSTIEINGFPKQKFEELKNLIYRELQNDMSLRIQKFTYNEYSNDYTNSFLSVFNYIKFNKDGSIYTSFPENLLKTKAKTNFKTLGSFFNIINKCLNNAFKLN